MAELQWFRCTQGVWCNLYKLDLTHKLLQGLDGVYVIWSDNGKEKKVLIIGEGEIAPELIALKKDIAMQAFQHIGVYVTWAEVPAFRKNSVANYLTHLLKPKMLGGDAQGSKTKVNSPFDN